MKILSLKHIKYSHIFLIIVISTSIYSQSITSPLTIKTQLSGTFGEIRNGHFHSGIDFKTNEREGYPIIAIDDGYVSRIKVSATGYGKALYITHSNGLTSVYAHLQRYNDKLTKIIRKKQFELKSFELDWIVEKKDILVNKGDTIGFSGNTGSSEGPHLHFELRESSTERPVNPLTYGINVDDNFSPIINQLSIYPLDNNSFVNHKSNLLRINTVKKKQTYNLYNVDTLKLWGNIFFGIETWDYQNNSYNKNGIYSLEIFCDDSLVFSLIFDKLDFNETRYVLALIDYNYFLSTNRKVITTYIKPGNKMSMFIKKAINKGIFNFSDNKLKKIKVIVSDFHNNKNTLEFYAQSSKPTNFADSIDKKKLNNKDKIIFHYNKDNSFKNNSINIEIPAYALYDSMYFSVTTLPKIKGSLSNVYLVGNPSIPLHKFYKISIKPDTINPLLTNKMIIASIDRKGDLKSEISFFENNYVSTKVRYFGKFTVILDTIAPTIKPVNIQPNTKLSDDKKSLIFKIKDNLSGIKKYNAYINDKWVIFEYDKKNDIMFYEIDENVVPGKNIMKIIVSDNCDNINEYSFTFYK